MQFSQILNDNFIESQMELLLESIPEAQGIFHLNLTRNTWISSNGVSQNVEELKDLPDVDMLMGQIAAFILINYIAKDIFFLVN